MGRLHKRLDTAAVSLASEVVEVGELARRTRESADFDLHLARFNERDSVSRQVQRVSGWTTRCQPWLTGSHKDANVDGACPMLRFASPRPKLGVNAR